MRGKSGGSRDGKERAKCLTYFRHQSEELYLQECGMAQYGSNWSFGPVSRPHYRLHAVLSGRGTYEVNGQIFPVRSGQLFLIKPYETTYYCSDPEDPWSYCWVVFDGSQAPGYVEQAGFAPNVYVRDSVTDIQGFNDLVIQMFNKTELNLSNDLRRLGLLYQFVALSVESYSLSLKSSRNTEYSPASYIDHALKFMDFNYAAISVNDVA